MLQRKKEQDAIDRVKTMADPTLSRGKYVQELEKTVTHRGSTLIESVNEFFSPTGTSGWTKTVQWVDGAEEKSYSEGTDKRPWYDKTLIVEEQAP